MGNVLRDLRGKLLPSLKRLLVVIGITMFLMLISTFANVGYVAKAHTRVVARDLAGYAYVNANVSIVYNPLLFSLSWLTGNGNFSGPYKFVSMPEYVGSGEAYVPRRKSPRELEQEAIMSIVVNQLSPNTIFNLIIVLAIKLVKMQDLYFCLFAGIIGFLIRGFIGALFGLVIGLLLTVPVMIRLRKGNAIATKILDFAFER